MSYLNRFTILPGLTTEGENLLDQVSGALPSPEHFLQIVIKQALAFNTIKGKFRITHDTGKDIIEIVGDTPGKGADRSHFSCLQKLCFYHLFFCYIANDC